MSFWKSVLGIAERVVVAAVERAATYEAPQSSSASKPQRTTTLSAGRPNKYQPYMYEGSDPPSAPGLYQLRNELTNEIDYIGQTADLNRRCNEHRRNGKIGPEHSFEWRPSAEGSTCAERCQDEKRLIKKHKPSMNKTVGGNGKTPKEG